MTETDFNPNKIMNQLNEIESILVVSGMDDSNMSDTDKAIMQSIREAKTELRKLDLFEWTGDIKSESGSGYMYRGRPVINIDVKGWVYQDGEQEQVDISESVKRNYLMSKE